MCKQHGEAQQNQLLRKQRHETRYTSVYGSLPFPASYYWSVGHPLALVFRDGKLSNFGEITHKPLPKLTLRGRQKDMLQSKTVSEINNTKYMVKKMQ